VRACVMCWLDAAADQKQPAASSLRSSHVDQIGELMEADDDNEDETMTSESRRSVHDQQDDGEQCGVAGSSACDAVGGLVDDAVLPAADAGASCIAQCSDAAPLGCYGDNDESAQQQQQQSALSQLPQQPATGDPSHNFLYRCISVFLYVCVSVRLRACQRNGRWI